MVKRLFYFIFKFILHCEFSQDFTNALQMELALQRVEQPVGSELIDASSLRVMKYNRTVAVLNGTLIFVKDLDDLFEFRVSVAYSRIGNNQFVEYPMKISQEKVCNVLNGPYREYQYLWANTTNFPQITTEERYCPFPSGVYWIKHYVPEAKWVPPMVPEGLWRMTLDVLDQGGEIKVQFRSYTWLRKLLV
ncbi:uncharacterized protein LOC134216210 [Armigeres subalbatus]|uniref:uncharacterized protein LOC134216210 n=1 Tax=Armigeres subalbatus TaxID=124917 RepID=UPI002ED3ABB4